MTSSIDTDPPGVMTTTEVVIRNIRAAMFRAQLNGKDLAEIIPEAKDPSWVNRRIRKNPTTEITLENLDAFAAALNTTAAALVVDADR